MIHRLSPRAAKPFVKLNCAAIAESLIESELFGHERGAFTGATRRAAGPVRGRRRRHACFSTRSASCRCRSRSKLLRVLEEREVRRVGATDGQAARRPLHRARPIAISRDEVDGRSVPARSVLPDQRRHARRSRRCASALARSRARACVRARSRRLGRDARRSVHRRSIAALEQHHVAGQHPRAAQHDRARGPALVGRLVPHLPSRARVRSRAWSSGSGTRPSARVTLPDMEVARLTPDRRRSRTRSPISSASGSSTRSTSAAATRPAPLARSASLATRCSRASTRTASRGRARRDSSRRVCVRQRRLNRPSHPGNRSRCDAFCD